MILFKSFAKLFDALLDIFERSFHGTNALVALKDSIVIVLVASHIYAKIVFEVLGEVSVLTYYKATGISVDDELGGELDVLFRYALRLDLVPIFDEVCLFLKRVIHDSTSFGETFWSSLSKS